MIQAKRHKKLSNWIGLAVAAPAVLGASFWKPKILPWLAEIGMCVGLGVWLAVMLVTITTALFRPERMGIWAFGLASALTSIHFMWGVCLAYFKGSQPELNPKK